LLKQFGGDTQKAAAAYNAGPGRVQQNIQQNQGQMNVSQLPRETQGYLQKIGQTVSNLIPSAQAGTLPQQPPAQSSAVTPAQVMQQPAPQPQPQIQPSPYSLATGMGQLGLRRPGMQPTMAPDSSFFIKQYVDMQDDPRKLIQYGRRKLGHREIPGSRPFRVEKYSIPVPQQSWEEIRRNREFSQAFFNGTAELRRIL